MSDWFYWVFCAVVIVAVVAKSRRPATAKAFRNYAAGGALMVAFALVIGYLFERTSPIDILLLREPADIYSILLVSVGYGIFVRSLLWAASRRQGQTPG